MPSHCEQIDLHKDKRLIPLLEHFFFFLNLVTDFVTSNFATLAAKAVATTEITPTSRKRKAIATLSTHISTATSSNRSLPNLNAKERVSIFGYIF